MLLPVDDDRIRWRLVSVPAALLVTTPAEMDKRHKLHVYLIGLDRYWNVLGISTSAVISINKDTYLSLFTYIIIYLFIFTIVLESNIQQ